MGPRPKCYIASHKVIGPLVLEKKIFKGFYHIWAWRPSCSCDPDPMNKLSFPHPIEAPYQIWLRLAQWFWRRSLKMVDRQRTDNGPWLYYKLTNEPKGSGELKSDIRLALNCYYPQILQHALTVKASCLCFPVAVFTNLRKTS